jgi:hypothetical protein
MEWPSEILAERELPALQRVLGRAARSSASDQSYEAWICTQFGVARQQDWPIAPLTLAADGGVPGEGYWLRADPVHLQADRDRLVLMDSATMALKQDEASALAAALNAHFAVDGLEFRPLWADRWYIRIEPAPDLVTVALPDAIGGSVDPLLPTGASARRLRTILNEAQMILHTHSVNEARELTGQRVANSVWFWGGGRMPTVGTPAFDALWGEEPLAAALSAQSGTACSALPADAQTWFSRLGQTRRAALVIEHLRRPAQYGDPHAWWGALCALDRDWIAPLVERLGSGALSSLTVTAFARQHQRTFVFTGRDRWRFWRRPAPLTRLMER